MSTQYKLIALDLDGTLIGPDLQVHERVRRAIAAAQRAGVVVTLATGREFAVASVFAEQLGLRDPLICYQGAVTRHPITGEIFGQVLVPGPLAQQALSWLSEREIYTIANIDGTLHVAAPGPELDGYLEYYPSSTPPVAVTPDLVTVVKTTPPTKLLFIAHPHQLDQHVADLAAHVGDQLSVVRSHAYLGEVTAPGISKGQALASLAARLGIAADEVIAIGDEENDISMLTWAGLGLAMGNANEAVKEVADAVIPSIDEAGVAWAIERYVLEDQQNPKTDG